MISITTLSQHHVRNVHAKILQRIWIQQTNGVCDNVSCAIFLLIQQELYSSFKALNVISHSELTTIHQIPTTIIENALTQIELAIPWEITIICAYVHHNWHLKQMYSKEFGLRAQYMNIAYLGRPIWPSYFLLDVWLYTKYNVKLTIFRLCDIWWSLFKLYLIYRSYIEPYGALTLKGCGALYIWPYTQFLQASRSSKIIFYRFKQPYCIHWLMSRRKLK